MSTEELIPETRFTALGEDRIAYQVFGEGAVDLLWVGSIGFGIDTNWYWPTHAQFMRQLATRARVIMFDRLGTGASDAPSGDTLPSWEQGAGEALVVLDAVHSDRAVLLGQVDAGPVAVLFAASQPGRTNGLIIHNTRANYEDASVALHTAHSCRAASRAARQDDRRRHAGHLRRPGSGHSMRKFARRRIGTIGARHPRRSAYRRGRGQRGRHRRNWRAYRRSGP